MNRITILLLSMVLYSATLCAQHKLKEIDANEYRELAQKGVAFVNFNVPNCDLAEYYNKQIEMLDERLTDIPIYFFDKKKHPEINKEFKLWQADKLAMVKDGKFVSHYKGIHGLNMIEKWMVSEWNKDKGTNLPLPNSRFAPKPYGETTDFEQYKQQDYAFDGNGIDKVSGQEKFRSGAGNSSYVNNCLYSTGVYKSRGVNYFGGWDDMIRSTDFTLFFEFMPSVTTFNTVMAGDRSSRFFGIEIENDQLVFNFSNGEWAYPLPEEKIEAFKWYGLAVSYQHASRELHVVLNGQQLKAFKIDKEINIKDQAATFGICNFGSGSVYKGYLNNLRIYKKALQHGDLLLLYNAQEKDFPDMKKTTGGAKVAAYFFADKVNQVTKQEDFNMQNTKSTLASGQLSLLCQKDDSYPSIKTGALTGLDPRQFSFYLDFKPESLGEHNFQYFVGLHGRGTRYLNVRTKGNEIEVQLELDGNELKFQSKGAALQLNQWHNFVLAFDINKKQLIALINGRVVLNENFTASKGFSRLSSDIYIAFSGFGNPYTFTGKVDNLNVYRSFYSLEQLKKMSKNRGQL